MITGLPIKNALNGGTYFSKSSPISVLLAEITLAAIQEQNCAMWQHCLHERVIMNRNKCFAVIGYCRVL